MLNARLDTERQEIVEFDRINLGIAVQGERGLVVPAVLGADTMTTAELDAGDPPASPRAPAAGRATAEELAAGTFTLNNYGSFRVDGSAAIINHPQVAILGFGRILDRPWVVDGEIVRPQDHADVLRLRPPGLRRRHGGRLHALRRRRRGEPAGADRAPLTACH